MRKFINLVESAPHTQPPELVYHGSKTPSIKNFEYRTTKRFVLFSEFETKANGFFFALTPQEAAEFGRYVSAYKITCKKPLISGHEGVNKIAPEKMEDLAYIFSALLEDGGNFMSYEGLVHTFDIPKDRMNNPNWVYEFIGTGCIDWEYLDNAEFVKRMRERGYDSTVVYENDLPSHRSWFVVSPEQITFVKEVMDAKNPYAYSDEEDDEEDDEENW